MRRKEEASEQAARGIGSIEIGGGDQRGMQGEGGEGRTGAERVSAGRRGGLKIGLAYSHFPLRQLCGKNSFEIMSVRSYFCIFPPSGYFYARCLGNPWFAPRIPMVFVLWFS